MAWVAAVAPPCLARRLGLSFYFRKMALSLDELKHIAGLAKLRIDPGEEEILLRQMGEIVAWVEGLPEPGGEETSEVQERRPSPERPDQPRKDPGSSREALRERAVYLEQAPEAEDGFFRVPAVLPAASDGGEA